jgi:prepilin-type N-terminal cleavage/methylation domain-containing protein
MAAERGFSLIEMVMAMALMMVAVGSVFSLLHPAQGAFSTEPEVADLQQRLRVAQSALFTDLVMTGAGVYLGGQTGSLIYVLPPVRPFRQGTVTVIYVPTTPAQTTLAHDVTGGGQMRVNAGSSCPRNPNGTPQNLCGFRPPMTVLIFDHTGNYDTFTVSSVDDVTASIFVDEPGGPVTATYRGGPPGTPGIATVTEAVIRTYFRKAETNQLVYSDGSSGPEVPVVDNVVDLSFEYWGDPNPPRRTSKPISDPIGPWQTYGPRPTIGPSDTAYPVNENCAFTYDGSRHLPRLPVLPSGENTAALVQLTESQLTDGLPAWCPDESRAARYDVDLLRIRKIGVTVRLQTAMAALRGPAGVLFRNGGTSRSATKWVPDQEVRFQVSPRNLNLGR